MSDTEEPRVHWMSQRAAQHSAAPDGPLRGPQVSGFVLELRTQVGRAGREKARSFSAVVVASAYEELFLRQAEQGTAVSAYGP